MNDETFIPYVSPNIEPEDLNNYKLEDFEHPYEVEGNKMSLYVMDFREEKIDNPPLEFYFMGFGGTDPVRPNELSAAVFEHAKSNKSILIVPRFEAIPKPSAADTEAKATIQALAMFAETHPEMPLDLSRQSVEITCFSDGAGDGLEFAGLIDKIPPEDGVKRVFHPISPTGMVDIIYIESLPRGEDFVWGFTKQVVWLSVEEARLRLNKSLELEKIRLNDEVHRKMAEGEITIPESRMAEAVKQEINFRGADGNDVYPLIKGGFKEIAAPTKAFDGEALRNVIWTVAKLQSFHEGRLLFGKQFAESGTENLLFLMEVIERTLTASPNFSAKPFNEKSFLDIAAGLLAAKQPLIEHFKANEKRSPVCDGLKTFDVVFEVPREDLIYPVPAFGRTIRRNLEKEEFDLSQELGEKVRQAVVTHDDQELGDLLMDNPGEMGYLLFPNAKSVTASFKGQRGLLDSTHLAPLKGAGDYIHS